MKSLVVLGVAALSIGISPPAAAEHHQAETSDEPPKAEIVETNEEGTATKVKIGDQVYDVCTREGQDSCINPRDAGLDFGRRELEYWPGKPASQIEEPLPAEKPVELPADENSPATQER